MSKGVAVVMQKCVDGCRDGAIHLTAEAQTASTAAEQDETLFIFIWSSVSTRRIRTLSLVTAGIGN
jgi:hypothetical protein